MNTEKVTIVNGLFGKIEIKHCPSRRVIDVDNYNHELDNLVSLESILKANNCDLRGYSRECYIATKNIIQNDNKDTEFKIKPCYPAEGSTKLEALQNLYKSLAEYQAVKELSELDNK